MFERSRFDVFSLGSLSRNNVEHALIPYESNMRLSSRRSSVPMVNFWLWRGMFLMRKDLYKSSFRRATDVCLISTCVTLQICSSAPCTNIVLSVLSLKSKKHALCRRTSATPAPTTELMSARGLTTLSPLSSSSVFDEDKVLEEEGKDLSPKTPVAASKHPPPIC